MPLPISRRELERLGRRLASADGPARADLDLLHSVLGVYGEALQVTRERVVAATGLPATSRVKNTGTIVEKLRRNDGRGLSTIQDLAGMRTVVSGGRSHQDAVAAAIGDAFLGAPKATRTIDRRTDPRSGYRAIHMVVFPTESPIEIQVRTTFQHEWAEAFEKLGDAVGRQIRYGGRAKPALDVPPDVAKHLTSELIEQLAATKSSDDEVLDLALELSDSIDRFEVAEQRLDDARLRVTDLKGDHSLDDLLLDAETSMRERVDGLRTSLAGLARLIESVEQTRAVWRDSFGDAFRAAVTELGLPSLDAVADAARAQGDIQFARFVEQFTRAQ